MEDIIHELDRIIYLAEEQATGGYTTEADALQALELIKRLALLLAQRERDNILNNRGD